MDAVLAILPFVILGDTLLFIGTLVGLGVATRRGYVPSALTSITIAVIVALLSVLPTEVASILWLTLLSAQFEVTANLFLLVPAPIITAMIAMQAFVLEGVYRRLPILTSTAFLVVFTLAYAFWLSRLFNPPADIARYVLVILICGSVVFGYCRRVVWRRSG